MMDLTLPAASSGVVARQLACSSSVHLDPLGHIKSFKKKRRR
jgi:hypothetical protein